jgi:high-affinity iron transporter
VIFDAGSFTSGLLIGLREGVEAALIVAIVLAYLAKTGHGHQAGRIWVGVAAAAAISFVAGVAIFLTVGSLRAPYEQLFEGITMLLAAIVVTWMLFWMRRQSAGVGGQLRRAVDRVLSEGGLFGLSVLAFSAVIREGIETSLFLVGQAQAARIGSDAAAPSVLVGALLGLIGAGAIGYGFYRGSRRIDLARFFRWTGIGLIFIAAGLVASAIHEFIEIGAISVGTSVVFDLRGILPSEDGIGQFLRAIFGYTAQPEGLALGLWATYILVALGAFIRPIRRGPGAATVPAGGGVG